MKSTKSLLLLSIAAGLTFASAGANAALVVVSTVGGAAAGTNYVNFDNLGASGGVSNNVTVSFSGNGSVTQGATDGISAPPYISASNGAPFGDSTVSGVDTTNYITTGIGSASLLFPGMEHYLGLLWGSVDNFNTLDFYSGANLVGTLTGTDIFAAANGDQGVNGTYYANIVSSLAFDKVVASSTSYAFELDNVAYNATNPVPEPFTIGLLGLGLAGLGARRRKQLQNV